MADWETATRCPTCATPGKPFSRKSLGRDGVLHIFVCDNGVCPFYQERWIVQVRADGTIPHRDEEPEKLHKGMDDFQKARARRELEDMSRADPSLPRTVEW